MNRILPVRGGFVPGLNYSQPSMGRVEPQLNPYSSKGNEYTPGAFDPELNRISIFSRFSTANPRASEPQASLAHFGDLCRRSRHSMGGVELELNCSRTAVTLRFFRASVASSHPCPLRRYELSKLAERATSEQSGRRFPERRPLRRYHIAEAGRASLKRTWLISATWVAEAKSRPLSNRWQL